MPVTNGYAYELYDHGVFGPKQQIDFADVTVRPTESTPLVAVKRLGGVR